MTSPDPQSPSRVREIFLKALELDDPKQRENFLDASCAENKALRAHVEALLANHKDDSFLNKPAIQPVPSQDPGSAITVSDGVKSDFPETSPPQSANAPAPGSTLPYFGDYQLIEEIARGGMGVVWKARQKSLNRIVALKMILAGQFASEGDVKRFRIEAEAAANLQHPNIVAIHEVGEHEGRHYFSMDYVEGKNLAELLRGQPLTPAKAAQWVKTMAEAIQYAHQRGILHRDLKPQNVLIDERDQPRVTDFGLAKLATGDRSLTQTGAVMGSPSYMPPEQTGGRYDQVGPHSDVYSLGAVLYELLTNKPPHAGSTPVETLRQVLEREVIPPSRLNPLVNADLETICLKCLEKDSRRRYATARELGEDLARFLNHEPVRARRANPARRLWSWLIRHPWIVTGGASLLALLTVGFGYRMWERVAAVEWSLAHPKGQLPYGREYFFPQWFNVTLGFEFFLLQWVPVVLFLHHRAKNKRENWLYGLFACLGVGQILFGLEILRRAMAAQAWNPEVMQVPLLASIVALTNVWLGGALMWQAVRESRVDLPGIATAEETAQQPLGFANRDLILKMMLLEFVIALGSWIAAGTAQDSDFEKVAGLVVGPFGMWGATGLALILRLIWKSTGLERQSFFPLGILALASALIGMIGLSSEAWHAVPLFYVLGIAAGKFLIKRAPLERGHWLMAPGKASGGTWLRFSEPGVVGALLALEWVSLIGFLLGGEALEKIVTTDEISFWIAFGSWGGMFGATLLVLIAHCILHARWMARIALLMLGGALAGGLVYLFSSTEPRPLAWSLIAAFHLLGCLIGSWIVRSFPLQRGGRPVQNADAWAALKPSMQWLWSQKTAQRAGWCLTAIALFYLVEDWRGIHAWNKAKARLAAEGTQVEWAAWVSKASVPDEKNAFKHPFILDHGIRKGWTGPVKNFTWGDGFVDYGPSGGPPVPMTTLLALPKGPQKAATFASLSTNLANAAAPRLIALANAPIADAIRTLAEKANVRVLIDTNREPFTLQTISQWNSILKQWSQTNRLRQISFQAENATPAAALDALLKEHHLRPEFDSASGSYRIQLANPSLEELMERLSSEDPQFRQLEEALQRPQAQLSWTEETPLIQLPAPGYILVRKVAQGLATRSKIHLLQGDPDAAFGDLKLIKKTIGLLLPQSSLVGMMTKVAVAGMLANNIEEGLAHGFWPPGRLADLQSELSDTDLLRILSDGLQYEKAFTAEAIRRLASPWKYKGHGTDFLRMFKMQGLNDPPTPAETLFAKVILIPPRGWFYQNMVHLIETPDLRAAMDFAHQRIWPGRIHHYHDALEKWGTRQSPYRILAQITIPNFTKALIITAQNQTLVNEARVACALERFRAAKGRYPESLDALVPEFAAALPHDLFDGQPLRYRRDGGGGYLLYSIGWDSRDDGGTMPAPKDGSSSAQWAEDQGDWVWQGAPKP